MTLNHPTRTDTELDDALAQGRVPGPRADALWARIDGTLTEHATSAAPSWGARLFALPAWVKGIGALLPAAALALFLIPADSSTGLQARGDGADAGRLVASCGAVENPCPVGERVLFQWVGGPAGQRVEIDIITTPGAPLRLIAFTASEGGQPLTQSMVPEASDVEKGVTLRVKTATYEQRVHLKVSP